MAGRKRGDLDDTQPSWDPSEAATTLPEEVPALGRTLFEDDRPTELHDRKVKARLHTTREQRLVGSTISDVINSPSHRLSRPLAQLVAHAQEDLPGAQIDDRADLRLSHEFEFDRRVGYRLRLALFDSSGRCVVVEAEVDHDGNRILSGSMIAKLMEI